RGLRRHLRQRPLPAPAHHRAPAAGRGRQTGDRSPAGRHRRSASRRSPLPPRARRTRVLGRDPLTTPRRSVTNRPPVVALSAGDYAATIVTVGAGLAGLTWRG